MGQVSRSAFETLVLLFMVAGLALVAFDLVGDQVQRIGASMGILGQFSKSEKLIPRLP